MRNLICLCLVVAALCLAGCEDDRARYSVVVHDSDYTIVTVTTEGGVFLVVEGTGYRRGSNSVRIYALTGKGAAEVLPSAPAMRPTAAEETP